MKKNLLKTLIAAAMMATSMTAMAQTAKLTLDDTPESYEAFKSHFDDDGKFDVTYTRTLGGTTSEGSRYGTLYLPFQIKDELEGINLYSIVSIANDVITLRKVTDAEYPLYYCTPLIYELTEAANTLTVSSRRVEIGWGNNVKEINIYYLMGYNKVTEIDENIFFMSGDKYVSTTSAATVQPFRLVLKYSPNSLDLVKPSELPINNPSSGINGVNIDTPATAITDVYDANGRKQSGLQHGVNIVRHADGSTTKVIVK